MAERREWTAFMTLKFESLKFLVKFLTKAIKWGACEGSALFAT